MHLLLLAVISCDFGSRLRKAKAVGNGLSPIAPTQNVEEFRSTIKKKLVLWTPNKIKLFL
jgi:hypothetical protein